MKEVYLDWAATAPVDTRILERMKEASIAAYGNPSSTHNAGRDARSRIEGARTVCAGLLGISPSQLLFTSGGSESNAISLLSLLRRKRSGRILISSIEHASVWELGPLFSELGYEVVHLKPNKDGLVEAESVSRKLSPDTVAVAVMGVNNETGAIQPIKEIGDHIRSYERIHDTSIHFHCDMVQALAKIPIDLSTLPVDTAAFSGHKIGAPRGIGMLYIRNSFPVLFTGGGQEHGMRPGTENTPAIAALELALQNRFVDAKTDFSLACEISEYLCNGIQETDGCRFIPENRRENTGRFSPYIVSFSVAPVPGEVFARVLSDRGILIGTGSACSSNRRKKKARVLDSMGVPEDIAAGVVRVSFSHTTTISDVDTFVRVMRKELAILQRTLRRK